MTNTQHEKELLEILILLCSNLTEPGDIIGKRMSAQFERARAISVKVKGEQSKS